MKILKIVSICSCLSLLGAGASWAEPVPSYSQARDAMLKKAAEQSKKKKSKFSPQERKLMQDSLEEAKRKFPSPGLKVGQKAPDFTLNNAFGKPVSLYKQLKKGPVVLVFYRGAWCPFCSLHLRALHQSVPAFAKHGARLITVTPQTPDKSAEQLKKTKYSFEVLSDLDDKVMKQYGLYFQLSPALVKLYKSKGLDLEAYNGKGRTALPVPGTFVIASDGTIKAAHGDHDYKQRMEPADIIKVLKQL